MDVTVWIAVAVLAVVLLFLLGWRWASRRESAMSLIDRGLPDGLPFPDPVAHAIPSSNPRKSLKTLFFLTVTSFSFGLACYLPYLEREHRRMEPGRGYLLWVTDLFGLGWFTWYFVKHYILGGPVPYEADESPRITKVWWFALVSLVAFIFFDLSITGLVFVDEQEGRARAVVVEGEIRSVKKKWGGDMRFYTIQCRFQDAKGAWQDTRFVLREDWKARRFQDGLAEEVQQSLRNGKVPCPISIAYDPILPARNWVDGIENEGHIGFTGEGRFHRIAWIIRFFQGVGILMFIWQLLLDIKQHQTLPWWYDLHMALPFMIEAVVLGLLGGLFLVVELIATFHGP